MSEVEISLQTPSQWCLEVDLKNPEWSGLLPESLGSFQIEEHLRSCSVYSDGTFPGAKAISKKAQVSRVKRFPNYIEFSKIVSDEVVPLAGQKYLTTKFYDRRKIGWASDELQKKEGEVLGYCIDGDIYSVENISETDKMFYGTTYHCLISTNPLYLNLIKQYREGISIKLRGGSKKFLENLASLIQKGATGSQN